MRIVALLPLALVFTVLPGCAAPAPAEGDEATAVAASDLSVAVYVDAEDYLTTSAEKHAWHSMEYTLATDFHDVCGSTFCAGDYPTITSVSFRCSVKQATGAIKQCAWVFTGSAATVTGSTGTVHMKQKDYVCPLSVSATTSELAAALTAPGALDALHRPLPNAATSAYDALTSCL